MKKLFVLFLTLFYEIAAAEIVRRLPPSYNHVIGSLLKDNLVAQQDTYKRMVGLEGATSGIWVPLVVTTGLKQELSAFDIGKALVMTSYVRKEFVALKDKHQKLVDRACELKGFLGAGYDAAEYPSSMPTKAELLEYFCAGFLMTTVIHVPLKMALDRKNFSAVDFMVYGSIVFPFGTALVCKNLVSSPQHE